MKRKNTQRFQTRRKTRRSENADGSSKVKEKSVGGNHPSWNIIIPYLNFQSQLKMSQQNHRLADLVKFNAEYQLKKFRRRLQEDKYM